MISAEYVNTMARYNRWQNTSLINAAHELTVKERQKNRGSFFGSIEQTFSHLLWGDMMWMHRFAATEKPAAKSIADSASKIDDWSKFCQRREAFDGIILRWSVEVSDAFLGEELSWFSGASGAQVTKSVWSLVVHMFNHQTHHRGQLHAMITAAGGVPEDTDLFLLHND